MRIKVESSTRKDKKLMATIGETTIHFGAKGYSDFTKNKDPARKANYISRHKNENWGLSGIKTAGFWAKHLLWAEPTLAESVAKLNRKFPSIHVSLH